MTGKNTREETSKERKAKEKREKCKKIGENMEKEGKFINCVLELYPRLFL